MREICTLGARWRGLETDLRQLLNGHEEGNLGYKPRRNLRGTAPVLDPTAVPLVRRFKHGRCGWHPTVYTKNRDRLLEADVAKEFFRLVVAEATKLSLMSDEHFTVDGTLLEACASLTSFKKKDGGEEPPADDPGNPTVDFHGERRSNDTHASTTDEDALLARKGSGKEAKLSYSGHVLMENRNGLVAEVEVLQAHGTAERDAALLLMEAIPGEHPVTVGADKNYDTKDFVAEARHLKATPHVAQNVHARRRSAIDGRTTRHAGYGISQRKRKRVEEIFGWMKTVGGMRKLRHRGLQLVAWMFTFAAAAYNLVRMRNLTAEGANA